MLLFNTGNMTDEESDGVPRRHIGYLVGSTLLATGGSVWWQWDNLKSILAGRDESFTGTPEQNPTGTPPDNGVPEDGSDNYGGWTTEVPTGCELPSSYEDEVESYVDDIGMDSSRMDEYVESGGIGFERDGTELGLLVDRDDDGQYDSDFSGNFENLCG